MTRIAILAGTLAVALASGAATAAPCSTGTTTGANGQVTKDRSSSADGQTTANVTPGAKSESPGTVGALGNVGDRTKPVDGERKPAEGKVVQGQGNDDC